MFCNWWERLFAGMLITGVLSIFVGLGVVVHDYCVDMNHATIILNNDGYNNDDVKAFCNLYHVDQIDIVKSSALRKALDRFIGNGDIMAHKIPVQQGKTTNYESVPSN